MDGVLIVNKPQGLTSHDVVAAARRALRQQTIGHTGTLDPLATGVLPLACGRATRLVRFLTAGEKEYEAVIRFGLSTDSYDITGREITRTDKVPSPGDIVAALEAFRGAHLQEPPPVSAKKIGGRRAYSLARAGTDPRPGSVPVHLFRLDVVAVNGTLASVRLSCSAGFYVRSLAHAAGLRLGVGGCLEALRRTRSGEFELGDAVTFTALQEGPDAVGRRVIALDRLLSRIPAVTLTEEGRTRVSHGRFLETRHYDQAALHVESQAGVPRDATSQEWVGGRPLKKPASGGMSHPAVPEEDWVRLLDGTGALIGLGRPLGPTGSLHPSVVLI